MIDVVLPAALLIGIAYYLHHLPARLTTQFLPSHSLTKPRQAKTHWTIERSTFTLSLSTKSLNPLPRYLISISEIRITRILRVVYDVSIIIGVMGMAAATAGAVWATTVVWNTVWQEVKVHAGARLEGGDKFEEMLKRGDIGLKDIPSLMSGGGVQPLIPGLTTPLSHLPTMVLALVLNQLMHELGHALAAALEDIAPSRLNFSLHLIIPSASVVFEKTVDQLRPKAKMRLATSGPFHNILVYLSLLSITYSGLGSLFWTDRSDLGRVVSFVHPQSHLHDHLHPGDIITHLDEVSIAGPEDKWTAYLTGNEISDEGRGWCMDERQFKAAPLQPCMPYSNKIAFVPVSTTPTFENTKCISSHPMLDALTVKCPCANPGSICVRPQVDDRILRIRVKGESRVVVFSGAREAVLLTVAVSRQGARLLGSVTRWGTMFVEYLTMISLSLFIFNLLPLPHTDGSQLLQSILSSPIRLTTNHRRATLHSTASEINLDEDDEDDGEEDDRSGGRWKDGYAMEEAWKRRLRKSIEMGLLGVCAAWGWGWLMLGLLRSS